MEHLTLILVIFIAGTVCDGPKCDDKTKSFFSMIFCDKVMNCANETDENYLDNFRECFTKSGDNAKEIIESGNKLEPEQCIKEISNRVCEITDDLGQHPGRYAECVRDMEKLPDIFKSCMNINESADESKGSDDTARLICSDPEIVKCDTNDAMEVFKLAKKCMNDKNQQLEDMRKTNPDIAQCKSKVLERMNENKEKFGMECIGCLAPHQELIQKNDPIEHCTGL